MWRVGYVVAYLTISITKLSEFKKGIWGSTVCSSVSLVRFIAWRKLWIMHHSYIGADGLVWAPHKNFYFLLQAQSSLKKNIAKWLCFCCTRRNAIKKRLSSWIMFASGRFCGMGLVFFFNMSVPALRSADFVCVCERVCVYAGLFNACLAGGSGWVWRHSLRSVTPFSTKWLPLD